MRGINKRHRRLTAARLPSERDRAVVRWRRRRRRKQKRRVSSMQVERTIVAPRPGYATGCPISGQRIGLCNLLYTTVWRASNRRTQIRGVEKSYQAAERRREWRRRRLRRTIRIHKPGTRRTGELVEVPVARPYRLRLPTTHQARIALGQRNDVEPWRAVGARQVRRGVSRQLRAPPLHATVRANRLSVGALRLGPSAPDGAHVTSSLRARR